MRRGKSRGERKAGDGNSFRDIKAALEAQSAILEDFSGKLQGILRRITALEAKLDRSEAFRAPPDRAKNRDKKPFGTGRRNSRILRRSIEIVDAEIVKKVAAAAMRAGCRVEAVPYTKTRGFGRHASRRRLIINDGLYVIHILSAVHRRVGRRTEYYQALLRRSSLVEVVGNIFYLTQGSSEPAMLIVPSIDLAESLFDDPHRERRTVYIRVDGAPGELFDFWQYEDAWPRGSG